jgi:hypothetical protein
MKLPLMSNKQVQESDSGHVTIVEDEVRSIPQEQIADILSKEYTRMVQENPEHTFAILRDGNKGVITISWTRRI